MQNSIKLQTNSVQQVPLRKYTKDFIFVANSEIFEVSSFVADLLSPIISSRHLVDPTLDKFVINTKSRGDFNKIINLIDFQPQKIDENDFLFIIEVLDQLGTEKVDIDLNPEEEITNDNIIDHIRKHQKHPHFFKTQLKLDIEYFISHFFELKAKLIENIRGQNFDIDDNVIESIISSNKIVLDSENDILETVNELYLKDKKFSILYEFVDFRNVESESMKKFIQQFDINDLTISTWSSICNRLEQEILNDDKNSEQSSKHKCNKVKCIADIESKPNEFDGIINYLQKNFNIKNELGITYSSHGGGNDPFNFIKYEDKSTYFETSSKDSDSWICFEFKNHQIIPSSYIIRSYCSENNWHLKSWKMEGSNDKNRWTTLDEQTDNNMLNGNNRVHLFPISGKFKKESFKYLRIHITGKNWRDNYGIMMNSIEFYGKII